MLNIGKREIFDAVLSVDRITLDPITTIIIIIVITFKFKYVFFVFIFLYIIN
jgi:hypothetical protein